MRSLKTKGEQMWIYVLPTYLVQRHAHVLLVLGVAVAADGVDLVNEDDAGRVLLGGGKQVAHAPGAHAHKHLRWKPGWVQGGGRLVTPTNICG